MYYIGTFLEGLRKSTINVPFFVCCALSIFHFALQTLLVLTVSSDAPTSFYLLLFVQNFKFYHVLEECFSPRELPRFLALKNLNAVRCHKPMARLHVSCCIVPATNLVLTVRWTGEPPHAPVALFGTEQVRVVLRLLYCVFVCNHEVWLLNDETSFKKSRFDVTVVSAFCVFQSNFH